MAAALAAMIWLWIALAFAAGYAVGEFAAAMRLQRTYWLTGRDVNGRPTMG